MSGPRKLFWRFCWYADRDPRVVMFCHVFPDLSEQSNIEFVQIVGSLFWRTKP